MSTIEKRKYFALFISQHLYFLPQFTPIISELNRRNKDTMVLLMCKDLDYQNQIAIDFCKTNGFNYQLYKESDEPIECKFMVNGGHNFPVFDINYDFSVSVVHGIGTKAGYYTDVLNSHDIRFIEGQTRIEKIHELFPDTKCDLFNVGFAKLDTAIKIIENEQQKDKYSKLFN